MNASPGQYQNASRGCAVECKWPKIADNDASDKATLAAILHLANVQ